MKQLQTLLLFSSAIFFASCSTVLPAYTPNVPFLKEKGDVHLAGSAVVGEYTGGGNVQAAYSPVRNFYLSSNASILSHQGPKSSMFELGLGYYNKIGENMVYELSAGGGWGVYNYDGAEKDKMSRLYLQGAIGYSKGIWEFGTGLKAARTAYKNNGALRANRADDFGEEIISSQLSSGLWTLEPFALIKVGGPKIKFQTIFSYPIYSVDYLMVIPEPTLSLGLVFGLGSKAAKN